MADQPASARARDSHSSPFVAVLILNWNNAPDTLACLASLMALDYPNFTVIVVDNGSTDDSVARIRAAYSDVEILETGENLGYAGGNNAGMRHALKRGPDYFLILNNDTLVDTHMLGLMVDVAESDPQVGIIGPAVYAADPPMSLWSAGSDIDWAKGQICHRNTWPQPGAPASRSKAVPADFLVGCGLLVSRKLVEAVGLLDTRYYLNYEDVEWAVRARAHGFDVCCVPQAIMWHKMSATLGLASPGNTYYMTRNALLFFGSNAPGALRFVAPARIVLRTLRTIGAWTLKPQYRADIFRRKRDARLLALRDALLGRWGKMGPDVAAVCYGKD